MSNNKTSSNQTRSKKKLVIPDFSSESSSDSFGETSANLTVGGLNVYSLLASDNTDKKNIIQEIIDQPDFQVDILVVGETWIKERHEDEHIAIAGFTYEKLDRNDEHGGILVYFRNNIDYERSASRNWQVKGVQTMTFNIHTQISFVLVAIYSPPKETYKTFSVQLITEIFQNNYPNNPVMVVGDLNICQPDITNKCIPPTNRFSAQSLVEGPTHKYGNCIDHIITNIHEVPKGTDVKIIARGVVQINHTPGTLGYISDHNLVWCTVGNSSEQRESRQSLTGKVSEANLPENTYSKQVTEKSSAGKYKIYLQPVSEITEKNKGTKTSDISQIEMEKLIDNVLSKAIPCPASQCRRLCESMFELANHVNSKHFICPKCHVCIKIKTNAPKHLEQKHGKFMCRSTGCKNKLFRDGKERSDHENDGNHWVCDQCDVFTRRAFTTKCGLEEHKRMKVHTSTSVAAM